jgi:hypothetical protein
MIKPWFLTEGKLAAVLIKPSSWGSQLDNDLHYHTPPQQQHTVLIIIQMHTTKNEKKVLKKGKVSLQ